MRIHIKPYTTTDSGRKIRVTARPAKWRSTWNGLLALPVLIGTLLIDGGTARHTLNAQESAQEPEYPPPTSSLRLTVRPHQMTLGTRNAQAGMQVLDTYGDSIYVPPSAVGTKRVPLALIYSEDQRFRSMADKYGMIIVTLGSEWQEGPAWPRIRHNGRVIVLDSVLYKVLSTYAIDPDKILLNGMSSGANLAVITGCQNLEIFSHLGLISTVPGGEYSSCDDTKRPLAERTKIFLSAGIGEPSVVVADVLKTAPRVRRDGHPLQLVLDLRPHQARRKDSANVLRWFADSWASPENATPLPPLESTVPLTTDILTKMTAFWSNFQKNSEYPAETPDTRPDDWPASNEKALRIPVASDTMTVFDMVDLPAITAEDSHVGAALEAAGITLAEEQSYRAAFIGARATLIANYRAPEIKAIPMVEQNVAFLREHSDDVNTLLDLMTGNIRCEMLAQEQMMPGSCER